MRIYTVTEYEESDYDELEGLVDNMSNKELSEELERLALEYLPTCEFSYEEGDLQNYREELIINKIRAMLNQE